MTGEFRWSRASEAGADVRFLAGLLVGRPLAILAVDLLVIWPVLALLSPWALFRAIR